MILYCINMNIFKPILQMKFKLIKHLITSFWGNQSENTSGHACPHLIITEKTLYRKSGQSHLEYQYIGLNFINHALSKIL